MYAGHVARATRCSSEIMIIPGVEQMYGTCRFAAKASSPLFRMDRVGLAEVRSARLPSSQSQRLAPASAVVLSTATSIGE
jgi:hypothetical protein